MEEEIQDIQEVKKATKVPTIKQVSILYTVVLLIFMTIGARAQRYDLFKGVLLTEFVLIAAPALIFLKIKGYNLKEVLRLNRVGFVPFIITFVIMLFSLPVISILNIGNLMLIKQIFGRVIVNQPPVATNLSELLIYIAIIGGSAGICEEILFRGVIQRSYEGIGLKRGIIITAFLFGMMHVDFQKLLGTFLLGGLIGYLVYKTKSIYVGMFAHFCNNSLAVLISYLAVKASGNTPTAGSQNGEVDLSALFNLMNNKAAVVIIMVVTWLFILGLCISVIIAMLIALNMYAKNHAVREEPTIFRKGSYKGILYTAPAVLLILFIYIYQGYNLTYIQVPILRDILRVITGG